MKVILDKLGVVILILGALVIQEKTEGGKSFVVSTCQLWNSLPIKLKRHHMFFIFQKCFKETFLDNQRFLPHFNFAELIRLLLYFFFYFLKLFLLIFLHCYNIQLLFSGYDGQCILSIFYLIYIYSLHFMMYLFLFFQFIYGHKITSVCDGHHYVYTLVE